MYSKKKSKRSGHFKHFIIFIFIIGILYGVLNLDPDYKINIALVIAFAFGSVVFFMKRNLEKKISEIERKISHYYENKDSQEKDN